jgi:hypothetical protein
MKSNDATRATAGALPIVDEPVDPIDRLCQIRDMLLVTWMALVSEADDRQKRAVSEVLNACTNDLHNVIEDMCGKELSGGAK